MIRDAVPGFRDRRQDRLRHPDRDGCHQRVQRPARGRGPLGLRRRPRVALYDQLVRLDPSPIITLNRAIAVAELDGPEVALAAIDRLEDKLAGYHAYHATRAEMLRRLGCSQKSRAAYDKAIELAATPARPPT